MSEKTREEALAHFGVKGMRWGVRKSTSTSKTAGPSKAARAVNRIKEMSVNEKRLVVGTVGTGAAVAASMLAGPVGGVAVSSLARIVDFKVASTTTTTEVINNPATGTTETTRRTTND